MYSKLLKSHPFLTQCSTTAVLFGLGDVLAQIIESSSPKSPLQSSSTQPSTISSTFKSNYDPLRTARLFFYGSCVAGPARVLWYRSLDKYIKFTPVKTVLVKVAMDQFIFAPVFLRSKKTFLRLFEVGPSSPWNFFFPHCFVWGLLRVGNTELINSVPESAKGLILLKKPALSGGKFSML